MRPRRVSLTEAVLPRRPPPAPRPVLRRPPPAPRPGWRAGLLTAATALTLLSAARLRRRARSLAVVTPSERPVAPEHHFLLAEGVVLDEPTRRAASAYARSQGLDVLDLIPGDLPAEPALELLREVDPATYRDARLAPGVTAGHAVLVDADVLDRAGLEPTDDLDPARFVALARTLKRYAPTTTDLVVAPGLPAVAEDLDRRAAHLRARYGEASGPWFLAPLVQPLLLAWAGRGAPGWAAATAAASSLQPAAVLAGGPLRPADARPARAAGRWPRLVRRGVRTLQGRWEPPADGDAPTPEQARDEYAALLADGTDRFFEPRRERCPRCDAADLHEHVRVADLLQGKPGEFVLDRCAACGHVFQNPRLTIEGLDFYYRDFYDGLGEDELEFVFAQGDDSYEGRVGLVRRHLGRREDGRGAGGGRREDGRGAGGGRREDGRGAGGGRQEDGRGAGGGRQEDGREHTPKRWLDVGAGHGHFCLQASGALPDTRFDGLDLTDSIDEAARRGWIDRAHRGLFPDLAPELIGAYDVVSMHHYLEHTRDPGAELDAAALVLEEGGHLLIEVPDPECRLGALLGWAWGPWFQPQHQHFLSVDNLTSELLARGFTVLDVERGPAHQPVDVAFGVFLLANRLGGPPAKPWRPDPSGAARVRRAAAFATLAPFMLVGLLVDRALAPVLRRVPGGSNTYRVLAQRDRSLPA